MSSIQHRNSESQTKRSIDRTETDEEHDSKRPTTHLAKTASVTDASTHSLEKVQAELDVLKKTHQSELDDLKKAHQSELDVLKKTHEAFMEKHIAAALRHDKELKAKDAVISNTKDECSTLKDELLKLKDELLKVKGQESTLACPMTRSTPFSEVNCMHENIYLAFADNYTLMDQPQPTPKPNTGTKLYEDQAHNTIRRNMDTIMTKYKFLEHRITGIHDSSNDNYAVKFECGNHTHTYSGSPGDFICTLDDNSKVIVELKTGKRRPNHYWHAAMAATAYASAWPGVKVLGVVGEAYLSASDKMTVHFHGGEITLPEPTTAGQPRGTNRGGQPLRGKSHFALRTLEGCSWELDYVHVQHKSLKTDDSGTHTGSDPTLPHDKPSTKTFTSFVSETDSRNEDGKPKDVVPKDDIKGTTNNLAAVPHWEPEGEYQTPKETVAFVIDHVKRVESVDAHEKILHWVSNPDVSIPPIDEQRYELQSA